MVIVFSIHPVTYYGACICARVLHIRPTHPFMRRMHQAINVVCVYLQLNLFVKSQVQCIYTHLLPSSIPKGNFISRTIYLIFAKGLLVKF